MNHYFSPVTSKAFPNLNGLVLFQLTDAVLAIRYENFSAHVIDGDHLYLEPIEQVMGEMQEAYGINDSQWRLLSLSEVAAIEAGFTPKCR
jgi:hypothetical protein